MSKGHKKKGRLKARAIVKDSDEMAKTDRWPIRVPLPFPPHLRVRRGRLIMNGSRIKGRGKWWRGVDRNSQSGFDWDYGGAGI